MGWLYSDLLPCGSPYNIRSLLWLAKKWRMTRIQRFSIDLKSRAFHHILLYFKWNSLIFSTEQVRTRNVLISCIFQRLSEHGIGKWTKRWSPETLLRLWKVVVEYLFWTFREYMIALVQEGQFYSPLTIGHPTYLFSKPWKIVTSKCVQEAYTNGKNERCTIEEKYNTSLPTGIFTSFSKIFHSLRDW